MITAVLFAFLLAAPPTTAPCPVSGVVRDTTGGVVAGASVRLETAGAREQQTRTAGDGRFRFETAPCGSREIIVSAPGFAERTLSITTDKVAEVVLAPAGPLETVTVTPTRT